LVSDIPAGDEENYILFYSVCTVLFAAVFASVWRLCCWGVDVSAAAVVSAVVGFTTIQIFIPAAASVPAHVTVLSVVFLLFTLLLLLTQLVAYVLSVVVVLVDSCC
jgi:hypothetical protein